MIKLRTIASQHGINPATLQNNIDVAGIPIERIKNTRYVSEHNLLAVQTIAANVKMRLSQPISQRTLDNQRYCQERLKRIEQGEIKRPAQSVYKPFSFDVIFLLDGIEKNGTVIGGTSAGGNKKVLIRYKNNTYSHFIDVTYDKVLHSEEFIDKLVALAKKTNSKGA